MKKFFRNEILETEQFSVPFASGIRLNQNESPWDLPIDLKVAITEKLIKVDWNRYPTEDDTRTLKNLLAKEHTVMPDQIVISNGSTTIIQALINIITPTSKVLLLDPTYPVYEQQALLHGNKIIKVTLSDEFELLTEKTLSTIKKERPALIFIANPNTPTGTLFDKKSLYRIIQMANCPVVIDEAFYYFTTETVLDWLSEFDNLVVLRTFSKAMGLAGVRFGYAVSTHEITNHLEKFLMPYRLSRMSCIIVEEILKHHFFVTENTQTIIKEKGRLFSKLQTIDGVQVFPSEANFLLIRIQNASAIAKRLMKEGFFIRDVSNETTLKDCLRITIGTPDENDTLLLNLKRVKNDLKKPLETKLD